MLKINSIYTALVLSLSVSAQDQRQLNVPHILQENEYWCWAASTNSVIDYYGVYDLELCEVVETARELNPDYFGEDDCCYPDNCLQGNFFDDDTDGSICGLLHYYDINNNCLGRVLTFNEVKTEINSGRPFIIRWEFSEFAHAITITGYDEPSAKINIIDPDDGNYLEYYSWVVQNALFDWDTTAQLTTTPTCSDANSIFTETINTDLFYEESNTIEISSTINNNADVEFYYGIGFKIEPGFNIAVGCTLVIEPDGDLSCN